MTPLPYPQAAVLMSVGHCAEGEEVKVTLRQFFEMYEKVSFDADGDNDGSSESNKGSFIGRRLTKLSIIKQRRQLGCLPGWSTRYMLK